MIIELIYLQGKSLCILCGSLKWLKNASVYPQRIEKFEKKEEENEFSWITDAFNKNQIETEESIINTEIEELKKRYNQLKIKQIKNKSTIYKKRKIVLEEEEENDEDGEDEENEFIPEEESSTTELEVFLNNMIKEEEDSSFVKELKHCNKIYYCSRTHSQLSQLIEEINKTEYKGNVRIVTLASRQKLCINKELMRNTLANDLNEKCRELREDKKKKCPYYNIIKCKELSDRILIETMDIEDLKSLGEEISCCPYYSVRYSIPLAEIVLLPYSVLLHKETRESLGIDITVYKLLIIKQNQSIILDEGHNVVNTINELYSPSITYNDIECLVTNIPKYRSEYRMKCDVSRLSTINSLCSMLLKYLKKLNNNTNQLLRVTEFKCNSKINDINLSEINSYMRKYNVAAKLRSFIIRRIKKFTDEERKENEKKMIPTALYKLLQFTESLIATDNVYNSMNIYKQLGRICITKQDNNIATLQYILLSPSDKFQSVVENARSIILIGGTLEPIEELKYQLFPKINKDKIDILKLDHIINPSQILCMILNKSVNKNELIFNYENRDNMVYLYFINLSYSIKIYVIV